MSKKTKSSSTTQSTATRTPTNPEWVTSGLQGLGGKITELSNRDPRSFVAGPSALQSQVFGDAGKLTTSPRFSEAGGIFGDVAKAGANTYESVNYDPTSYNASSLLEGLDKYMSPYTQDVVNTSLADYDYGAGQTRATQALDEARSGAFGGSGAAITRSMTEDAINRGRGALAAGLRDTGFTRGANLSATDAGFRNQALAANAAAANQAAAANAAARNRSLEYNAGAADTALARQLAAGGALANLGATEGADTRANLALQGQLGADQRAIEQAIAGSPLSVLQALAGTYGSLPLNLLSGETQTGNSTTNSTTKTSDPMSVVSTLGSLALAPFTGGASLAGLGMNALMGGGSALSGYSDPMLSGGSGFLKRFM